MKHGEGTYFYENGDEFNGEWFQDIQVKGLFINFPIKFTQENIH